MDLDLADYQELTVKTFRDFFTRQVTPQSVREADTHAGHDSNLWSRFTELGGPTLSLAEEHGGGGGTLLDAVLVAVESGRRVAPVPYADAVVARRLLADVADGALPDKLEADELVVLGHATSFEWGPGETLTAALPWVRGGSSARFVTVVVGERVALVDLDAPGTSRTVRPNVGHLSLAAVGLNRVAPLAVHAITEQQVDRYTSELRLLRAAELVGAGRQALALGREHVLARSQFGRVIGSFQAIQHRLADRLTALDAAELLLWRAASYAQELPMLRYYSAVALLQASQASELAAKESLQFFGGYGFTLEYDIHLYLRFTKTLGVLSQNRQLKEDALPTRLRVVQGGRAGWTSS